MGLGDRDGERDRGPESRLIVGAAIVLLVFGAVVARWVLTPFDDWVPLAAPNEVPAGVDPNDLPQSARFRCSAPWGDGATAVATEQATAALEARPLPDPSIVVVQDLTREPCADPRAQHRALGIADLIVSAGLLLALLTVHRRRRVEGGGRDPIGAAP